jgi:hypothetical protein
MENIWVIWEIYGKPGNILEIYGLFIICYDSFCEKVRTPGKDMGKSVCFCMEKIWDMYIYQIDRKVGHLEKYGGRHHQTNHPGKTFWHLFGGCDCS